MYKEFFGLKEYPFSLTPDPRFIVFTPSYNELLASLYYGIEMAKGLIVLMGEVGTGKTTAIRYIEDTKHYTGLPVLASVPQLLTEREIFWRKGTDRLKLLAGVIVAVVSVPLLITALQMSRILERFS